MFCGVCVSYRILYSFVTCTCSYLYVSCSESITSVDEERANLSAIVFLYLCGFCTEMYPLPLGAWEGLCYFIVALCGPSILLFGQNSNATVGFRRSKIRYSASVRIWISNVKMLYPARILISKLDFECQNSNFGLSLNVKIGTRKCDIRS